MKQILFTFFTFLAVSISAQNVKMNQEPSDTLSVEQNEILLTLTEQVILNGVDSIMNEGMYMQALEVLDSFQTNWKKVSGRDPSFNVYLRRGRIYMDLEEWQKLIDTTTECINLYEETLSDRATALLYYMQGLAYRNLEDYNNAIRSYEYAISGYAKVGDDGGQGDVLCSIAYSYDKLGKHLLASNFYKKGISKYFLHFNTTKKQLLQSSLIVDDPDKEAEVGLFSIHLLNMAVNEQDYGDSLASKEYLLMSAHCGNSKAKSEYERIYGRL